MAIGVNPSASAAVYSVLWLRIAKARQHTEATPELGEVAAKADLSVWPGAALKLYMGQITEDAMMAAASNSDPETEQEQLCEANFYAGEDAILRNRRVAGQARLRAARDHCPKNYIEYAAAVAELKRTTAAPAPAK